MIYFSPIPLFLPINFAGYSKNACKVLSFFISSLWCNKSSVSSACELWSVHLIHSDFSFASYRGYNYLPFNVVCKPLQLVKQQTMGNGPPFLVDLVRWALEMLTFITFVDLSSTILDSSSARSWVVSSDVLSPFCSIFLKTNVDLIDLFLTSSMSFTSYLVVRNYL